MKAGIRKSVLFAIIFPLGLLFSNAALPAQIHPLYNHVPDAVAHLQPIGSLEPSTNLQLAIALPLRNQTALAGLIRQIYDPTSPNYRHYLTPEQFTARFGPTESNYQKVVDFAVTHGLKITATYSNRLILDVSGPVSTVERALHVKFLVYQHLDEKRTFYAPDSEPSLDLTASVLAISGLDDYARPRPRLQVQPLAGPVNATSFSSPNRGSGSGGTFMGNDFRAAYVPGVILDGTGQSVGLLQFDGFTPGDIAYYEAQAGLPAVPLQTVLLDGFNGGPTGNGNEVEVALDIEMVISMATNLSQVIVYEAGPYGNWHDILNRMASDNLAKQLSCSWYVPGAPFDPVADQIFQEMAAQGQSFFSASGDYDAYTSLISFPGDSPYITQVGGTTLTTSGPGGAWVSETVWNQGNGIGSGGGISTQYPIPSWQTNISMAANQGSIVWRNTPDVAMTAANVYVRADGLDYSVGGTSCAAPLWAGLTALINQQAANTGHSTVGFINPAVYAIGASAAYSSAFHDVTTGNNESTASPTRFSAAPGYDLCTGWGTPTGQSLIEALAIPEPLVISPATGFSSFGGVGGPFTLNSQTFALTNLSTNALSWSIVNTSLWLDVAPLSGVLPPSGLASTVTASLNAAARNLGLGTYTGTLVFTNWVDGVVQYRRFTLNIINPPAIVAQPANQVALEGAPAAFNVQAAGGLPMFYRWQFNGTNLVDGGNISGSTTPDLVISSVTTNFIGNYSVVVSNFAGVAVSSDASLSLIPSSPVIVSQPVSQSVAAGSIPAFTVIANGASPYFYQWSFNGTNNPIPGATNATLALPCVQTNQAGIYAVVVSNAWGSIVSSNATLEVCPVPFITSFSPAMGVPGTNVNLVGYGFSPVPGNNVVRFGSVQAPVQTATISNLQVTLPDGGILAPVSATVGGLTAYSDSFFQPVFARGATLGASSFAAQVKITTGNGPSVVRFADLDGDGKPDVLVANVYDNSIAIYQNISSNGTLTSASFAPPVVFMLGGSGDHIFEIALADLDGDGRLDIVAVNRYLNTISIYQNLSTPGNLTANSFAPRVDIPLPETLWGVAVADLDGDGRPDIITASSDGNAVIVLRNVNTGGLLASNSFAAPARFAVGLTPTEVAVADLDGDAKPDVVTINPGDSTDAISILRNTSTMGAISFAPAVGFPGRPSTYSLAIADLDGDAKPDLAVCSFSLGQSLSIYRNTSTPGIITTNSFAPEVDFAVEGWGNTVALGDLDGDGKPDVVVLTQYPNKLSLFRNVSIPGSFTINSLAARVDLTTRRNPNGVALGDLDGDGRPDIVCGNTYSTSLSLYKNLIPFGYPPVITTQPTNEIVKVHTPATFVVGVAGSAPLACQWYLNGTNNPVSGATNLALTLTGVQATNAGMYAAIITNQYGSATSSNVSLIVYVQDHFAWSNLLSPQFVNAPFAVSLVALDASNAVATNFNGIVVLSASNAVPVIPTVSGQFIQGAWTGTITVSQAVTNLVLCADDCLGGCGLANPIDIINPPVLDIVMQGNSPVITWPSTPAAFVLESTPALAPANWVQVNPAPQLIDGRNFYYIVTTARTNCFYRLRYSVP